MNKQPVAYCGFTDTENIGDYAVFSANRVLFPDVKFLPGLTLDRRISDTNLFGGGTLYPFFLGQGKTRIRRLNLAIGLGVTDPGFSGGFGIRARWEMKRWRFSVLGVRGPRSQAILRGFGIDSEVSGDTALALRPSEPEPKVLRTVAINLVGEEMDRLGSREHVFHEMLTVCTWLVSSGRRIMLMPFVRSDQSWMMKFQTALSQTSGEEHLRLFDPWDDEIDGNVVKILDQLATCELMIGERLHASVLAAAANVPFLTLGYKPKCEDFVRSLNLEGWLHDSESCTAKSLQQDVEKLLSEGVVTRRILQERVDPLRDKLRDTAARVNEILRESTL